jgi:SSS family solute:Na+ symporter
MDRMLHRGRYAELAPLLGDEVNAPRKGKVTWGRLIGLDEHFTRGDTWIAGSLFAWNMLWFTLFVVGTAWNLIAPWPDSTWSLFWHISAVGLPVFISIVTAIWFTWGGLRDIRALFRHLRLQKANHLDDGTVVGHENRDERAILQSLEKSPIKPETLLKH